MINVVPCPCCGQELYRTGPMVGNPEVLGLAKGAPHVQSDGHGHFMTCPHCSKRVIMVSAPSPVGAGFQIGDVQPCAKATK